jgi:hypothetical protein
MYWLHSGWVRLRPACVQADRTQASMLPGHSRTVPSFPAEAIILPSGLNATPLTRPVLPVRGWPIGLGPGN